MAPSVDDVRTRDFLNSPLDHNHLGRLPLHPQPTDRDRLQRHLQPLEWDWDVEHADRKREAIADGAHPFQVDRRVLRDVVKDKMGAEVARIAFISSGTFHKAYLVTLVDGREIVARVARRFMPRLKTESEVATLNYLRTRTNVPVPTVYHYDASPYNRLGGEYILMSKAPGVPLRKVYHSLPHDTLSSLLKNLATILIPLFGHRFSHIGSLYSGPDPQATPSASHAMTRASSTVAFHPTPTQSATSANLVYPLTPKSERAYMNFVPLAHPVPSGSSDHHHHRHHQPQLGYFPQVPAPAPAPASTAYHVGPIISWPFFGSSRGELTHPNEINRGPWRTTREYLAACVQREIDGVRGENEGRSKPHRLHLDPDDKIPRIAPLSAAQNDDEDGASDDGSERSFLSDSADGEVLYRDYRRFQRSTFLVAHLVRREDEVRKEMRRLMECMERLDGVLHEGMDDTGIEEPGQFALDCHDLSLENVFVDEHDPSKITCIIDWESTTTRPLWAAAHLPSFLLSSPFAAAQFRTAVASLPPCTYPHAASWLAHEARGAALRYAHKCVEWDGWEEGLVDSILDGLDVDAWVAGGGGAGAGGPGSEGSQSASMLSGERQRLRTLSTEGDVCGGRGGELGLRLQAWLSATQAAGEHASEVVVM